MTVAVEKPNKHELRTRETRELLLRAAETVFARDGYEAADLAEIAALAGRTKGAIYAHFKSKEDIFLALWENHVLRYRGEMESRLERARSVEENRETLRQFYKDLLKDRIWGLLILEFKLFALRHPESNARLQERLSALLSPAREKELSGILGAAPKGETAVSRMVAVMVMQPMFSVLMMESLLNASLVDEETMVKIVDRVFDVLLPA